MHSGRHSLKRHGTGSIATTRRFAASCADLLASVYRHAPLCDGIQREPDRTLITWWFAHPYRHLEVRTTRERTVALVVDRPPQGHSARVLGVWPVDPGRGAGPVFAGIARDCAKEGCRLLDVEIPDHPGLLRLFSPVHGFVPVPRLRGRCVRIMVRAADPEVVYPGGWRCIRGA
ncbi:MAG: hypothetical protein JXA08_09435 [Methanomicrobiaceae archaeon]|nr:hypothetical protein [Methanomicrobiaceae archaeon]